MELVVREGHEVTIYGYEGEPFARILRDGTVQKNQRSPATYLNADRYAEAPVPKSADPKAPPLWETVDDSGTLRWHDHRMHYMATGTPPQVKDESKRTKVFDYEIPLRIDGREGAVEGTLFWVGPADTSKTPFLIAGVAIVAARRRGGADRAPTPRRRDGDDDGARQRKPGSAAPPARVLLRCARRAGARRCSRAERRLRARDPGGHLAAARGDA